MILKIKLYVLLDLKLIYFNFPSNNFVCLIAIMVGLYPLRHLPPEDDGRHLVMLDLLSRYKKI